MVTDNGDAGVSICDPDTTALLRNNVISRLQKSVSSPPLSLPARRAAWVLLPLNPLFVFRLTSTRRGFCCLSTLSLNGFFCLSNLPLRLISQGSGMK